MRRFALVSLALAALMSVFLLFDGSLGITNKTLLVVAVALVAAVVFAILSKAREE